MRNGKLKWKNQAFILSFFSGWLNSSRWGEACLYKSILLSKKKKKMLKLRVSPFWNPRKINEYRHWASTAANITACEAQILCANTTYFHVEGINPESHQALWPLANLHKYRRTCWTPSLLCSQQNPDVFRNYRSNAPASSIDNL